MWESPVRIGPCGGSNRPLWWVESTSWRSGTATPDSRHHNHRFEAPQRPTQLHDGADGVAAGRRVGRGDRDPGRLGAGARADRGQLRPDGSYGGRRHRQRRDPHADERDREQRVSRGLAAHAHRLAGPLPRLGGPGDELQDGRLPRVGEVSEVGGQPVGGHDVLRQVVGADGQEVDDLQHPVGQQRGARHLDHDPGLQPAPADPVREVGGLGDRGHHRRHHPGIGTAALGGRGDPVELAFEQARVLRRQPEAADAERGVLLVLERGEGDRLVRPRVEGADDDVATLADERGQHLGVDRGLLLDARARRGGRGSTARCGTARRPRPVRPPRPAPTRRRPRWPAARRAPRRWSAPARPRSARASRAARSASTRRRASSSGYAGVDRPRGRVDEHDGPGRELEGAGNAHHTRDAELAGDDRRVAGGAASLGDDAPGPGRGPARRCRPAPGPRPPAPTGVGPGDARLGLADESGDDPAFDVEQVGGPLGHQPAHGGEHVDELGDRLVHGRRAARHRRRRGWPLPAAARGRGPVRRWP